MGPLFFLWPCYLEEWLYSEIMSLTVLPLIFEKNFEGVCPSPVQLCDIQLHVLSNRGTAVPFYTQNGKD